MKRLVFLFLWIVTSFSHGDEWAIDDQIKSALEEVNRIRKEADLKPVTISKELSEGCYNHAKYLVINRGSSKVKGLDAHKEFPELEGYSENGKQAGKNSVINYLQPLKSVKGWEASFYHRIPLLQPRLKEIGVAYYRKGNYVVSLIDCTSGVSGKSKREVVFFPPDKQANVPTTMGPEIPHPMGRQGNYGYPLTVYFCNRQDVSDVEVELKKGEEVVDCAVSTPEKPATNFPQWNTICIIPKAPLVEGSQYTLHLKCRVNKRRFKETIQFTTRTKTGAADEKSPEVSDAESSKQVHEFRTWTSTAGSTIEAKLIGREGGKVILQKKNGSRLKVSPLKLSKADQDYLKGIRN